MPMGMVYLVILDWISVSFPQVNKVKIGWTYIMYIAKGHTWAVFQKIGKHFKITVFFNALRIYVFPFFLHFLL